MAGDLFGLFRSLLGTADLVPSATGAMVFPEGAGAQGSPSTISGVQAPEISYDPTTQKDYGITGLLPEKLRALVNRAEGFSGLGIFNRNFERPGGAGWAGVLNDMGRSDPGIGPMAMELAGPELLAKVAETQAKIWLKKLGPKAPNASLDDLVTTAWMGAQEAASGGATAEKDLFHAAELAIRRHAREEYGLNDRAMVSIFGDDGQEAVVLADSLPAQAAPTGGAKPLAYSSGVANPESALVAAEQEAQTQTQLKDLFAQMSADQRKLLELRASGATPAEVRVAFAELNPLQYSVLAKQAQDSARMLKEVGMTPEAIRQQVLEKTLAKFADPVYKTSPLQRMLKLSVEGVPVRAIAKQLGTTEGKVQNMLSKARPKFEVLADQYEREIIAKQQRVRR